MKVSKDKHLKAERKCLSAAAAEWSVTRDQTPGTIWGYHTSTFFWKIFANMYRERKTWSSRKFGERNFFLAKMTFSRWKNLEQPSVTAPNLLYNSLGTAPGGSLPHSLCGSRRRDSFQRCRRMAPRQLWSWLVWRLLHPSGLFKLSFTSEILEL